MLSRGSVCAHQCLLKTVTTCPALGTEKGKEARVKYRIYVRVSSLNVLLQGGEEVRGRW